MSNGILPESIACARVCVESWFGLHTCLERKTTSLPNSTKGVTILHHLLYEEAYHRRLRAFPHRVFSSVLGSSSPSARTFQVEHRPSYWSSKRQTHFIHVCHEKPMAYLATASTKRDHRDLKALRSTSFGFKCVPHAIRSAWLHAAQCKFKVAWQAGLGTGLEVGRPRT